MANADLSDEDFYLWTKAQADALRAAGRHPGRSNAVEWERVVRGMPHLLRFVRFTPTSPTVAAEGEMRLGVIGLCLLGLGACASLHNPPVQTPSEVRAAVESAVPGLTIASAEPGTDDQGRATFLVEGETPDGEVEIDLVRDGAWRIVEIERDIPVKALPAAARAEVMKAAPTLVIEEIERKERDGRVYLDVEGVLPDGSEQEFDLLQTDSGGWRVVETQRDITWAAAPEPVRTALASHPKRFEPARVIESVQEDGTVIFELFQPGKDATPALEIRWRGGVAEVLSETWPH